MQPIRTLKASSPIGFCFLLALALSVAGAAPRQTLSGHVPAAVKRLSPAGTLPAAQRLSLAIGLPLRNKAQLDALLQQLYDPASPNYRRYLTPEEFTARFGPTAQEYQALKDFAQSNGLTVTATHSNRVVLDVSGTVNNIERAFHLTLRVYKHPKEARSFYAPDVEPSLDSAVPILHISGLDNYSLPHPNLKMKPPSEAAGATRQIGSGPGHSYRGSDFRNAYVPGSSLNGAGQSVGLLQFDGFYTNDIASYARQAGLPNIPLTVVPVDGGVTNSTEDGNAEVSLDIEMVMSMAPGLSRIYVYEAPLEPTYWGPFWDDLLNRMANDNLAKQLSSSWGGGLPNPTAEQIFQQMASQGQSFFNASGDSDAFLVEVPFPSDSTNITIVGGTTLITTDGGAYRSERVWNENDGTNGSSGGISGYYELPYYQQGISMFANRGSPTMRNVPDVALAGDNVYVFYGNGNANAFSGTSCAAPLWAGFAALINQQAEAAGLPPVGFMNPALYSIGNSTNYTTAFHDITNGNNFSISSPGRFSAVPGYDLCTGWGTPNGTNLINLLNRPTPWIVSQPQSQRVRAGDTVSFSVEARGEAPFSYQWLFSGQPIDGATNSSYGIARVQSVQAGTYTVTVSNPLGSSTSAPATLSVDSTTALGVVGAPFGYQIIAANHPTWYSAWGLPSGLICDGPSGFISGIPTQTGTFLVHLEARNLSGIVWSAVVSFTIAHGAISSPPGVAAILWVPFAYQIIADNNPMWYSASGLPPGLVCNGSSGLISGTPTKTGTFLVRLQARNLFETVSTDLSLTVFPPAITSATRVAGQVGTPFNYQITADNNPVLYLASGLPAGLKCNTASGLISGIPAESGTFPVQVKARNYWGTASATILMAIVSRPATQPALTILRTDNGVLLSWPSGSGDFILEETQIQPVAWTNSSAAVVTQGNENIAAIPANTTARFYRLRK